MPISKLIVGFIILSLATPLSFATSISFAKTAEPEKVETTKKIETKEATEATEEKTELVCQKTVKNSGPGNTMTSIAQLKAIIAWVDIVTQKHGEEYAQWHKAQNKNLKCKKKAGSFYYYCDLNADPCADIIVKPDEDEQTTEQPTPEKKKSEQKKQ